MSEILEPGAVPAAEMQASALRQVARSVRRHAIDFDSLAAQCEHQGRKHREIARMIREVADQIEAGRLVEIEAALRLFDGVTTTAVVIERPQEPRRDLMAHLCKLLRWSGQ